MGKGATEGRGLASWLKQALPLGSPGAGRGGDSRGPLPTWESFLDLEQRTWGWAHPCLVQLGEGDEQCVGKSVS